MKYSTEGSGYRMFEFKRGEQYSCTGLIVDGTFNCIIKHTIPDDAPAEIIAGFFKEAENAFDKKLKREAKKNGAY